MKKPPVLVTDPQVFAVLHRTGQIWRGVLASSKTGVAVVLGSREFAADQISRLDEWLDEHVVGSVLCVLPAGAVICRNTPLPDAAPEQLQQALHLQAEAHLLGIAPPHRLAMAVLPNAPGETTRIGLVLAWPLSAEFAPPATSRPVTFVPDVAAIAAILNGQRPNEPLMWLDRHDGSVAMAVTHAGGVIFRAVREDSQSSEIWSKNIGRIAAETALSVGHTGEYIESLVSNAKANAASLSADGARLFAPAELIAASTSRLQGASNDSRWWAQYGIAAGAILARTGQLHELTRLQDSPPIEKPSPWRHIAERLSHPQTAALVIAACVGILMFGPLVFSGIRLGILNLRFRDIEDQLVSAKSSSRQLAVYQELSKQKTWPMTKLLADITVNTPLGIELESIRIESGKDFAVGGTAIASDARTPAQLVALFQDNLSRGGMFNDVAVNSGKTDNLGRYKFDLSAKVIKPFLQPKLSEELDFGAKPWSVRLYGESTEDGTSTLVSNAPVNVTAPPAVTDDSEAEPIDESQEDERASRVSRGDGVGSSMADRSDDRPLASPFVPPPPIDVEQLKVMSKPELKDALAKVAKARLNRDMDKEISARLKQEQDLIMEYLRKAGS